MKGVEFKDFEKLHHYRTRPYSSSSERTSASSSCSSIEPSDSEVRFSSDDLYNCDSLLLSSSLHPEISVNGKATLKEKYSVICVHVNQFYTLWKKCCPSELAYIASLSRCKKWGCSLLKAEKVRLFAHGGNGGQVHHQANKEFESFIEFAANCLKHACHSLHTGSQTCLAQKIGMYQIFNITIWNMISRFFLCCLLWFKVWVSCFRLSK